MTRATNIPYKQNVSNETCMSINALTQTLLFHLPLSNIDNNLYLKIRKYEVVYNLLAFFYIFPVFCSTSITFSILSLLKCIYVYNFHHHHSHHRTSFILSIGAIVGSCACIIISQKKNSSLNKAKSNE